jgi:hypothetical protein
MILSKLSGMAGHGSFPMRVVGSPMTNNLVRTNLTEFYHVSTYIRIFFSVLYRKENSELVNLVNLVVN